MKKDELVDALTEAGGDLSDRTKDELMEMARDEGVEGRSGMTKDELVDALGSES
jgi:hypothetical protein